MLCSVDVDYRTSCVVAACVGFREWPDATAAFQEVAVFHGAVEPYQPGQFYRRELPPVVDVLRRLSVLPEIIVIDGHVWLGPGIPGLGARLYEALDRRAAVVGVAKRPFQGTHEGVPVLRGRGSRPLLLSSVGIATDVAVRGVTSMHGPHRLPTLLKLVDRLARDSFAA